MIPSNDDMKIPRFSAVFFCAAAAILVAAVTKAMLVSGLDKLPPAKMLVFAATMFGLVAAGIDWALLRDVLPLARSKSANATPRERGIDKVSASNAGQEPALWAEPLLDRARSRPIVFREICPPAAVAGLSFYGGIPIGPKTFRWPRVRNKPGDAPLSFILQWSCAELVGQDVTGLLPRDGVLYLFGDLTWGEPFDFQFIHAPGPEGSWRPLPVPPDMPPVYGDEGAYLVPYCSARISKQSQNVPQILPRWPFAAVACSYPGTQDKGKNAQGSFWNEGESAEAILALEHPDGVPTARRLAIRQRPFGRPFMAFPHDFAAVRIVTAKVLDQLSNPTKHLLREMGEQERETKLAAWREQATRLYILAAGYPASAAIEQSRSDEIWEWMSELEPVLGSGWGALLEQCVNVSFGLGSDATGAIPTDLIATCTESHRLATVYVHDEYPDRGNRKEPAKWEIRKAEGSLKEIRSVHAPCPNHMFGPPSYVQGDIEPYVQDWLLLLELSSRKPVGHEFGEGVLQFMIRPADLKERRFDRVKLVASAY